MPDLDVTDLLSDPDFCETFDVIRRTETMVKGRGSLAPTTLAGQVGVILPSEAFQALERGPDDQVQKRKIEVHTRFLLQGPSPGMQPDIVVWNGDQFLVVRIYDYSRFGQGFIAAECASMDLVDNPPGTP